MILLFFYAGWGAELHAALTVPHRTEGNADYLQESTRRTDSGNVGIQYARNAHPLKRDHHRMPIPPRKTIKATMTSREKGKR
jgi:hypothetical protein